MNRARDFINRLEEVLLAFCLALMTLLTALQVLLRYVFNAGLIWSLEATTYCFAWLVLLGMSYCVRTRTHIAVDLLVKQFGQRTRKMLGLLAIVVCLVYSLLMLHGSSLLVHHLYMLGNEARDLPIARWLLSIMLPLGFALLAWRFVQLGLAIWRGYATGLGFVDNAAEKLRSGQPLPQAGAQKRPLE